MAESNTQLPSQSSSDTTANLSRRELLAGAGAGAAALLLERHGIKAEAGPPAVPEPQVGSNTEIPVSLRSWLP